MAKKKTITESSTSNSGSPLVDGITKIDSEEEKSPLIETQNSQIPHSSSSIYRSKSMRAGINFPVTRVRNNLRKLTMKKIQQTSSVYLSSVLEYLCAELAEISGDVATVYRKRRITPRHLKLAIAKDEEFDYLLKNVTVSEGGVLPHLHSFLLNKPRTNKKKKPQNNEAMDIDDDDDN